MPDFSTFGLGRVNPPDSEHINKYPMTAALRAAGPTVERELTLPPWHLEHDQGQEGACFPAGTLVRLADGSHKAIEMVTTLDRVVTAEGNEGVVIQTMVRRTSRLVKVRLRGHMAIRCTPEHPFLTQRGYVAAEQLTSDDRVAVTPRLPRGQMAIDTPVSIHSLRGTIAGQVNIGGVVSEIAPLPSVLTLTPALGRLIGLYAAAGHVTPNKVVWSFGGHEDEALVAETVDLIKSCFDARARIQRRPNGSINVVLYGKTWMRLFRELVPGTAKHGDKRLSPHVASGDGEFLRGVLEGWLAGDGHERRNELVGVTVSKALALDMHAIANGLGLAPTVRRSSPSMNRHAATREVRYDVAIPVGTGIDRQPPDDAAAWRTVVSVTDEAFEGWVHNLHVAGDESYVADGLGVHNCVGFGTSMALWIMNMEESKREGTEFDPNTRYDSWWLWREARLADEWPDNDDLNDVDQGTFVRAAADVLRVRGHCVIKDGQTQAEDRSAGILKNLWATSVDDIRSAIDKGIPCSIGVRWYSSFDDPKEKNGEWWIGEGDLGRMRGGHCVCIYGASDQRQAFKIKNSWGGAYPLVYLPYSVLEKELADSPEEGGAEVTLFTDRPRPKPASG